MSNITKIPMPLIPPASIKIPSTPLPPLQVPPQPMIPLPPPPPRKAGLGASLVLTLGIFGINCGSEGRVRTDAGQNVPPGCFLQKDAGARGVVSCPPDASSDAIRRDSALVDRSLDAVSMDATPDAGPDAVVSTPDAGVSSDAIVTPDGLTDGQ